MAHDREVYITIVYFNDRHIALGKKGEFFGMYSYSMTMALPWYLEVAGHSLQELQEIQKEHRMWERTKEWEDYTRGGSNNG